jgi:hypothetical protein
VLVIFVSSKITGADNDDPKLPRLYGSLIILDTTFKKEGKQKKTGAL